jgi:hypothetical protein
VTWEVKPSRVSALLRTSLCYWAVLGLLIAALPGCDDDRTPPRPSPPSTSEGGTPGPELTITGRVMRRIEDRTFELGRDADNPLLVLSVRRIDVEVGTVVRATGRVRTLRIASLETELDIDLADDRLAPFEGAPLLVVATVDLVEPSRDRPESPRPTGRSVRPTARGRRR